MTRYVDHNHGLILGSGNHFFVAGDGEVREGYAAIVWARGYEFETFSTANAHVQTPAQQLMWHRLDHDSWELSSFVRRRLTSVMGEPGDKWDVRSTSRGCDRALFFKRRKDALWFARLVDSTLAGIKMGSHR